jgi:polysaccharide export outer membrane protein
VIEQCEVNESDATTSKSMALRHVFRSAVILLACCVAILPSYAQSSDPGSAASRQEGRDLVIGPEDSLDIVLLGSEEITKVWRVGATGDLNLPLVGRMRVAGSTVEQFEHDLSLKLLRYYKDPQLTVFISEFRSQPITVTGAVVKPGTTQLEGNRTLFDVIMRAGGPKDAGPAVTLARAPANGNIGWPGAKEDSNGYSVATFELTEVMDGRSTAANIPIEPYDVVSVQQGKEQKLVHVIGEVYKPGSVELLTQNTVSLLKVLALAGGLTRGAAPTKARIIHVGPDGSRGQPAIVNLKTIMNGKALDLELTAGDILIVPPASGIMTSIEALGMSAATTSIWIGLLATL